MDITADKVSPLTQNNRKPERSGAEELQTDDSKARVRKWLDELPDFRKEKELWQKRKHEGSSALSAQDTEDVEGWDNPSLYDLTDDPPPSGLFGCLRLSCFSKKK